MALHYDVLGVPPDATAEQIRAAYRQRARELHPDRNPSADAAHAFIALHEAYEVLSDTDARARYDSRHGIGLPPEWFGDDDEPVRPTGLRRRDERGPSSGAEPEPSGIEVAQETAREIGKVALGDVVFIGSWIQHLGRLSRPAGWVLGAILGGAAVGLARWVSLRIGFTALPVIVFLLALAVLVTFQTIRSRHRQ